MENSYLTIMQQIYRDRKRVNPSYSLRSFARDLGLYPSTLSMLLNGKKGLSPARSREIAVALKLPEWKIAYFCDLVAANHAKSPALRAEAKRRLTEVRLQSPVHLLPRNSNKIFSSWIDMAVLELTYLKKFQPSVAWVAKILGVREAEVKECVDRLKLSGHLKVDPDSGSWKDASAVVSTPDGIPSESLRNLQKTILQKAIRKLDEESVEKRVAKAVIFSTSKANFSRAREILNDAITRIVALADESHEERNKVLCFSAQLFSVLEDS